MLRVTTTAQSGARYISPFIQSHADPIQVPLDATTLTSAEVTSDGYLKPGVIIGQAPGAVGSLITGGGGLAIIGVTVELAKIAASNSGADLTAAGNVQVAVGTRGIVSRALAEEMLGRAYTADEVAALRSAGSHIALHE